MTNVNTATIEQLESLPGITAEAAGKIIANRPFADAAALEKVVFIPTNVLAMISFTLPTPQVDTSLPVWAVPATNPTVHSGGPLNITTGGTYTGTATMVTIAAGLADSVILSRLTAQNVEMNTPSNIAMLNCTFAGGILLPSSNATVVVWRFVNLIIENNQFNGGGGLLFRDFSGKAVSARVRFNKGVNISGATGPTTRVKCSFIQAAMLHIPNLVIDWNRVDNERGKSAIEDPISFMCSGGTPQSWASMSNNCVNGVYAYPSYPQPGGGYSGSGCMTFDPGNAPTVSVGGYSNITGNLVVDSEAKALPCAGGHHIAVTGNLAVKDGTGSPDGESAYYAWNWDGKTPADLFGVGSSYTGNQSHWIVQGKPMNYQIDPAIEQADNAIVTITQADALAAYAARATAAGVVFGPIPA